MPVARARGVELSDDEYDVVVASGEQVTAGLLALTLRNMGLNARTWMGWQIPILTDDAHGRARIDEVPGEVLGAAMDRGEIAVVPGFQGVSRSGRITTLGRGGSDTSAVAVAAALNCPCDIYTDVDGVYTTDPRIESRARASRRFPTRKCWRWPHWGPRCCRPARSNWPWPNRCRCVCYPASSNPTKTAPCPSMPAP